MKRASSTINKSHVLKTSQFMTSKKLYTTDSCKSQYSTTKNHYAQTINNKMTKRSINSTKEEPFDVDKEFKKELKKIGNEIIDVIIGGTCTGVIIATIIVTL
ncbi:hypothetical protein [Acanthamoeba polyphaga mimivirus]|uniref:Uncharacterized protein n=4 Tax=Megamimivirinae TaxID=3044648 RepID=A0A2L2DKU7_MIMIV|nr:hypothetical protein LBA_01133 [Megavirus lba]AVG46793.1 hypothetical protein [Acanthamoeba polyphaga mimivirus]